MAILTVDSLIGCSSIPDFFQGTADGSNPTKTIFYNSTSPTSWTKDTTHDDKALRVIGGSEGTTLAPGGSTPFASVFASRSASSGGSGFFAVGPSISIQSQFVPVSPGNTGGVLYVSNSNSSTNGVTSNVTLSTDQINPHTHPYTAYPGSGSTGTTVAPQARRGVNQTSRDSAVRSPLGASSHNHPVTFAHTHSIQQNSHTHTLSSSQHAHPSSSVSADFRILYVDVIIATKN